MNGSLFLLILQRKQIILSLTIKNHVIYLLVNPCIYRWQTLFTFWSIERTNTCIVKSILLPHTANGGDNAVIDNPTRNNNLAKS